MLRAEGGRTVSGVKKHPTTGHVSFPEPGKVLIRPDLGDWVRDTIPAPGDLITVEADAKIFRCTLPPNSGRIG